MAKKKTKIDHRTLARAAVAENGLSDDAQCFLRCNPAAHGNELVLAALSYMDDCIQDGLDAVEADIRKELEGDYEKGELFALEQFRDLLDAAMCLYDEHLKEEKDRKNVQVYADELYKAALICEKYRKNLEA